MDLLIKLPDGYVGVVMRNQKMNGSAMDKLLRQAVIDGTPLPKGHGRLIDADETIKTLKSLGNRDYRREKGTIQEAEKMLSYDEYTPTILEADTERR
jgi:hypothetical protein